jgi:flavin-binding protein dodecin
MDSHVVNKSEPALHRVVTRADGTVEDLGWITGVQTQQMNLIQRVIATIRYRIGKRTQ